MEKYIVRTATLEDAPSIARVHVDSWRTTYAGVMPNDYLASLSYEERERMWLDALTKHAATNFAYVAEDAAGKVVGFASAGPESNGDPDYRAELFVIYLLHEHQRKGIGRKLISAVAARLLEEGFESMLLWVLDGNPACEFYEALGGQRLREKPYRAGGVTLVEVAYGWRDISGLI